MALLPGIDVSYYDGHGAPYIVTDWASYSWPYVFIKVSEGTYIDALFMRQWAAARGQVLRSAYHFFRPSVDPRLSAMKTVEYLQRENDLGELPLAFDLEVTDGVPNVLDRAKSWLSWYEAMTGVRPIIYSSLNFLNNIVHAASYPFLANYKLWLSAWPFDNLQPAELREKRIADVLSGAYVPSWPSAPSPFRRASFWQWTAQGKPAQIPGYYTGPRGKKEIDLNFYKGSIEELRTEFGVTTETPDEPPDEPPIGETMQGKVLRTTNLRANNNQTSPDLGDLIAGDIVTYTVKQLGTDGLPWCLLTDATRSGVPVKRTDGKTVAEANVWAYAANIEVINGPVPTPSVIPLEATIKMSDGSIYKSNNFQKAE